MKFNKQVFAFTLIIGCITPSFVLGQDGFTPTGFRTIIDLGCEISGECFVTVDGEPFGQAVGCVASTQARWHTSKSIFKENGRGILAMMITAQVSGKKIDMNLIGCFDDFFPGRPNSPTFNFIHIRDGADVP